MDSASFHCEALPHHATVAEGTKEIQANLMRRAREKPVTPRLAVVGYEYESI